MSLGCEYYIQVHSYNDLGSDLLSPCEHKDERRLYNHWGLLYQVLSKLTNWLCVSNVKLEVLKQTFCRQIYMFIQKYI